MTAPRVVVHVQRDERQIVIAARSETTGARSVLSIHCRAAAALAAQLTAATAPDTDDGWEAETALRGDLETTEGVPDS